MGFFSYFQKRRMEMQETAEKLGLEFRNTDEYGQIAMMKDFQLFKKGYGKRISNILSVKRDFEQADIRVFDYKYVIGAGNSTRKIMQTVFYIHSKELNLPELLIKPEYFFHRIGEFFGMQDIDFEAFPIFSDQYLVQGPDEDLVKAALNEKVLHYFTVEKNWSVEGLNYLMIFYRHGKRIAPAEIEGFYKKGMEIFELFKKK